MKKLMIAVAMIATATLANAAAMKWSSGTIYLPGEKGAFTSTKAGTGAVSGQMYAISATEYSTWIATLTAATTLADQQAAMTDLFDGLTGGTIGTKPTTGGTGSSSNKGAIAITDPMSYTPPTGGSVDAYAAVIYTYTDANDKNWYIADVGKFTFESDNDGERSSLAVTFGGTSGTQAIAGWATSAVPEPTSGLLLLLGVAGLALRRRRA